MLLTLGVGVAGAIAGGFIAQMFGHGSSALLSFFALAFALAGASLCLVTYKRLIGV